jgi:hypothetical protein
MVKFIKMQIEEKKLRKEIRKIIYESFNFDNWQLGQSVKKVGDNIIYYVVKVDELRGIVLISTVPPVEYEKTIDAHVEAYTFNSAHNSLIKI